MTVRHGGLASDRGGRPSGPMLATELRRAAIDQGVPLKQLVAPLVSSTATNFMAQLERAETPLQRTVERVRACIAGQPLPPAPPSNFKGGGVKKHRPHDGEIRWSADEIERRRAIADQARAERRPGETIDQALKRITEGTGT